MIRDSQNLLSDGQGLTASAASTNVIDFGADRNMGVGEPMGVVVTVDVAADYTTQNETYAFGLQTDSDEAFGTVVTVLSRTILATSLTAGSKWVLPLPGDGSMSRYFRAYYTLGGTTPTITVSAALVPLSMIQNDQQYADAITIQ